jgi:hypothetical protein
MAMRLQRFVLSETNNSHRYVVLALRSAAKELLPLCFAAAGDLISWPLIPFKPVKVFGGSLHGQSTFVSQIVSVQ